MRLLASVAWWACSVPLDVRGTATPPLHTPPQPATPLPAAFTAPQCVPEMSEHEANTNAVVYANKAMSHVEGGWPKDVDYSEAEHTIRYRKKVGTTATARCGWRGGTSSSQC